MLSGELFFYVGDIIILFFVIRRWIYEFQKQCRQQKQPVKSVRHTKEHRCCIPRYLIEYTVTINEGKSSILVDGYLRQWSQRRNQFIPSDLYRCILQCYGPNEYMTPYTYQRVINPDDWYRLRTFQHQLIVWFDPITKQSIMSVSKDCAATGIKFMYILDLGRCYHYNL